MINFGEAVSAAVRPKRRKVAGLMNDTYGESATDICENYVYVLACARRRLISRLTPRQKDGERQAAWKMNERSDLRRRTLDGTPDIAIQKSLIFPTPTSEFLDVERINIAVKNESPGGVTGMQLERGAGTTAERGRLALVWK